MTLSLVEVDAIARTILYEGYALYPYRASSLKNQQRWTFGGLVPSWVAERSGGLQPCALHCQCVLAGSPRSTITAALRFLHPMMRTVAVPAQPLESLPDADLLDALRTVDQLTIGDLTLQPWQEMTEASRLIGPIDVATLCAEVYEQSLTFPGTSKLEPFRDTDGKIAALYVRRQPPLEVRLRLRAAALPIDSAHQPLFRLTIEVRNETSSNAHDDADLLTLGSAHVALGTEGGAFVSLMDPPPTLAEAVRTCKNERTWPVLLGPPGSTQQVLCSPIILYDHPQVAPESPGDLFDATENDELLTLSILSLTEDERRHVRALDERTRALLARTDNLSDEQLAALHGTIRSMKRIPGDGEVDEPRPLTILVEGQPLGHGAKVRLQPRERADVYDIVLRDKIATIETIEEDFEGRVYATVTIDDDPGRDLGIQGHRFFFFPHELGLVEEAP